MKIKFKSNNSAFDKYVSGDLISLTDSQKQGMLLFYTKAQCVRCHGGSNFSDQNFHSVATPQIGFHPFTNDLGRAADSGLTTDQYKFKTPSLQNISLTAPCEYLYCVDWSEKVAQYAIKSSCPGAPAGSGTVYCIRNGKYDEFGDCRLVGNTLRVGDLFPGTIIFPKALNLNAGGCR